MLKYDQRKLKRILIEEHGFDELNAADTSETLINFNSELQEALDQWLKDRTVIDHPTVEGITLKDIEDKMGSFINALTFMNGFLKDPEDAKIFKEIGFPFMEQPPRFPERRK